MVVAVQKKSAKEATVLPLFYHCGFFTTVFNVNLKIEHITGKTNYTADDLSRFNMYSFLIQIHRPCHCHFLFRNLYYSYYEQSAQTGVRLDITSLQMAVQYYYQHGLTSSHP